MSQAGQPGHAPDESDAYTRLVVQVRGWREAGDYRRADQMARAGITAVEQTLGPTARELVVLLNELGIINKYRGQFREAERLYQRALAIHQLDGDVACADVAAILHNLGGLAHAQGRHRAARRWARRGLAIRESLPDSDPTALAADRVAPAAILIDLGEYSSADALLASALAQYERTLGAEHHAVGVTLHNIGCLQYRSGSVTDAAATLHRAYGVKVAALGPRHPDLAITLYARGRCAGEVDDPTTAAAHFRHAIDLLEGAVADDQPTLVACRAKLASLLAATPSAPDGGTHTCRTDTE